MAIRRRSLSATVPLALADSTRRMILHVVATLALVVAGTAQAPTQTPAEPDPQANSSCAPQAESSEPEQAPVTLPAGTRFALVLTHPVDSKSIHRGDEVYAQTTAPVAAGDQVVIPAGTFVQGQVDRLMRKGNRGEFVMQSVSVLFPNGYVVRLAGPLTIESDEGTAWRNPSNSAKAGAIVAPLAGAGLGAAIGSAAHTTQSSTLGGTTITTGTPKGLAIGSMVGLAAGGVVALVLLVRSHEFYVPEGAPMEMTLPEPLTLSENKVADAVKEAEEHPPALTPIARQVPAAPPTPQPANHGTCYTPDTPGTPPTAIPGTPGPDGIPGAPTVIPGTPPIPGTPYPCP